MKKPIERFVYGTAIALGLLAVALFAALPELSLVTSLVYQGF
jgi:hypothetical protein